MEAFCSESRGTTNVEAGAVGDSTLGAAKQSKMAFRPSLPAEDRVAVRPPRFRTIQASPKDPPALPRQTQRGVSWPSGFGRVPEGEPMLEVRRREFITHCSAVRRPRGRWRRARSSRRCR
jgi:hypothetical protein